MTTASDRQSGKPIATREPGTKSEAAVLASWYASRPQVRRLWAIDKVDSVLIVMKIEPTLDDYDALPIWIANRADWAEDLASTFCRPVNLAMLGAPLCVEALSAMNEALIVELAWREEYYGWP